MFWRVFAAEGYKLRRSRLWGLLMIGPLLVMVQAVTVRVPNDLPVSEKWAYAYTLSIMTYGMLFLPIIIGVLAAFVCRFEHLNGGWKQMLALPVSRTSLYFCKFIVVALLLALVQMLVLAAFLCAMSWRGAIGEPTPWTLLVKSTVSGWVATLPLAALQMWVSVLWRNFGVPLAMNVVLTLPAILAANSETFGPFYPWAQPLLAMLPQEGGTSLFNVSLETLFIVIIGGFLVALVGGWQTFVRRDITA